MTRTCVRVKPVSGAQIAMRAADSHVVKCLGGALLIGLCVSATPILGEEAEL